MMRGWSGTRSPARTGRWRGALLILPLLVSGVAVAGCSSGAESGSSAQAPSPGADGAARAADGAAPQEAESGAGAGATGADQAAADRRRVSRGCVVVTVTDLSAAATKVRALAAGHGGYVAEESMGVSATAATDDYYGRYDASDDVAFGSAEGGTAANSGYADTSASVPAPDTPLVARPGEARIVLRVDPDQTSAVMDAIAAVGTEASRWRTDTDVEATLVDLQARIETKTQSIATLRGFLAKTSTVQDIITLEQEISTRTADLESMKARQSALTDAVAYSTVTAVLRTPQRSEEASENSFVVGLKSGWAALTGSLRVLLVLIGALLPFAVVVLALGLPARKLLAPRLAARRERRRARRAAQPPAWPGGTAPPAPVGQSPVGQAPSPAPVGQAPAPPVPAGQAPAGQAPTGQAPTGQARGPAPDDPSGGH